MAAYALSVAGSQGTVTVTLVGRPNETCIVSIYRKPKNPGDAPVLTDTVTLDATGRLTKGYNRPAGEYIVEVGFESANTLKAAAATVT
ncbi:MAG: hypothetical protein K2X82_02800 [Gemmataceae bacterium]|nr:hypothetical protein [Gemmataceae bacterium]